MNVNISGTLAIIQIYILYVTIRSFYRAAINYNVKLLKYYV